MVVVSDTAFLVVDFDVVPDVVVSAFVVVVVVFDVLVAFAVVTVVVVTAFDDFSVLEVVSAAVVVVWLTAEVTAVGSSFTVFSVVPQAVSMADNMMISIAFFIAISSFSATPYYIRFALVKPFRETSTFWTVYTADLMATYIDITGSGSGSSYTGSSDSSSSGVSCTSISGCWD